MGSCRIEIQLDGNSANEDYWHERCANVFDVTCNVQRKCAQGAAAKAWALGEVGIVDASLAWLSLSQVRDPRAAWTYVGLIVSGAVVIEQRRQARHLRSGEMFVIDTREQYTKTFLEPTHMVTLRLPEKRLVERGIRYRPRAPHAIDMRSADVRAVADSIRGIAAQDGTTSIGFRRRQGEQLLELFDVVFDQAALLTPARSGGATLFRAKRFIAENLHSADLSPALVAACTQVSQAYLNRLFRARDNTSLMRYVWDRRLSVAAQLLRERSGAQAVSISEVAYVCGFTSHAHFIRLFKARYGVAPRVFFMEHYALPPIGSADGAPETGL
jgi:AraC-like DNA-binding protein